MDCEVYMPADRNGSNGCFSIFFSVSVFISAKIERIHFFHYLAKTNKFVCL